MPHTPGPWHVEHEFNVLADRRSVAACGGYQTSADDGAYIGESKANARLIAAAPELLALAEAYEQWEADLVLHADWSDSVPRMTQAQFDRLLEIQTMRNAALAAAKGETP